jgi:4-amino-4-deoxy-L-arabinose transferase-like glycosyltransferase
MMSGAAATTGDGRVVSRLRTAAAVLALVGVAGGIYLWRLSDAPIHLTRDEVFVGLTGQSLAARGRDLDGHFLPVYVYSRVNGTWWPPVLVYAIACVVRVLPFSEATVRAPMALAAVANVVLAFLAGRLLIGRRDAALAAAVLLALAPAQVIENRYANDTSLPATFALGWALALAIYADRGSIPALCAAGALLGVGAYSYVGALALTPLYAVLTLGVLRLRREPVRRHAIFAAAFAVPFALGLWWLVRHPTALEMTFLHYQRDELHQLDGATAARLSATVQRGVEAVSLYARFWNPRVLFVDNVPWLMHSTGHAGVLLLPVVGLLMVGIVREARRAVSEPAALVLIGAFLLAPVPASLVDPEDHTALHATWRGFTLVPFGALLAGVGLDAVLTAPRSLSRWAAALVALAVPVALLVVYRDHVGSSFLTVASMAGASTAGAAAALLLRRPRAVVDRVAAAVLAALAVLAAWQFADFYRDYLGDYQERFTVETDGNFREVLEAVIAELPPSRPSDERPPVAYLAFRLGAGEWGANYWLFYLRKHRRDDLMARTVMESDAHPFSADRICWLPPESRIAIRVDNTETVGLIKQMMDRGEVSIEGMGRPREGPRYGLLRTTGSCAAGTTRSNPRGRVAS